ANATLPALAESAVTRLTNSFGLTSDGFASTSSLRRPERKNKDLRIRAAAGMKVFATELRGKTVMTEDGQILGILADFLVETKTGRIPSLLVTPAETVATRLFKSDPEGRLTLNFRSMKAVRDVIVVQLAD